MAQRKVKVKLCDRDLKETPASTTVQFSYLGTFYELDLCEKHADAFDREMAGWTRVATEIEIDQVFTSEVSESWRETLSRGDDHRRDVVGAPVRGTALLHHGEAEDDDADAVPPPVFEQWGLTDHVKQRMLDRGFTDLEVMQTVVAPEKVFLQRREGYRLHQRGRVAVVVHHEHRAVVTVMFRHQQDWWNWKNQQAKELQDA